MDTQEMKDFAVSVQRMSKSATFILDNPEATKAFAVCLKDSDGRDYLFYGIFPEKKDAELITNAINNTSDNYQYVVETPVASNGSSIKEIPDIRKYKTQLAEAVSEEIKRIKDDNSMQALHMLSALASC